MDEEGVRITGNKVGVHSEKGLRKRSQMGRIDPMK